MTMKHPDTGEADLQDSVSVLLTASRTLVAISASSLAEVEDILTLSEFRALVVVHGHGACRESSLAGKLAVGPATARRVVARLLDDDFLRREADEVLHLTGRGEELVERVTRHRRAALTGIVSQMDEGERRALVDALLAFARAAGEPIVAG